MKRIFILFFIFMFLSVSIGICALIKYSKNKEYPPENINTNASVDDLVILTLDELFDVMIRHNIPITIAEIEIIDLIPKETHEKYNSDLYYGETIMLYYNAKVNRILYSETDMVIPGEIVFAYYYVNMFPDFKSNDKFLCVLVSSELECQDELYKGIYGAVCGSNGVFDIKSINGEKIIVRRNIIEEDLFGINIVPSQKDGLADSLEKEGYELHDKVDTLKYAAEYDLFEENLIQYAKEYKGKINNTVDKDSAGNE